MNVEALSSQASARAALLVAQQTGPSAQPSAAQLQADRNALAQKTIATGKPSAPPPATPEQIKKAASQFEAIILRQLLAPTIEPVMSGSMGGGQSSGGGVYGYMLTDVLANSLAQGGGLGWGRMLEKQLSSHPSRADITSSKTEKPSTQPSPL